MGTFLKNCEMDVAGTPCEHVIKQARLIHFPGNLLNLLPIDPDIVGMEAAGNMGLPLVDSVGNILKHLAVMDTRTMPAEPRVQTIFRIFASRASAELQRLQAESATREREQEVRRFVDSAMNAIIELDENLRVTRINPAAEKMFQCKATHLFGKNFPTLLPKRTLKNYDFLSKISIRNLQASDLSGFPVASRPSALTARNFTRKPRFPNFI